jgi:hypothetical protein
MVTARGDRSFSNNAKKNVDVPQLALFAPSFVVSRFVNVNLTEAKLSHASFNDSSIANSNFGRGKLDLADFRSARISYTSFRESNLYRAIFDGAILRDVSFADADLNKTSFVNVSFGVGFDKYFTRTAWWRAFGWNSTQLRTLSRADQTGLIKTEPFMREMSEIVSKLHIAPAGSYIRAEALNGFAWMLATYGTSLSSAKDARFSPDECEKATGVPDSAKGAAVQAICIVDNLNKDGTYDAVKANFEDTLGYVLIQTDDLDQAAYHFEKAGKSLDEAGLFRYSIVEYAKGKRDNNVSMINKAINDLERSMRSKRYLPSHEFSRLKKYLTGDFGNILDPVIDHEHSLIGLDTEPGLECPLGLH